MATTKCVKCGKEIDDSFKFCPECGTELSFSPRPLAEGSQHKGQRKHKGCMNKPSLTAIILCVTILFITGFIIIYFYSIGNNGNKLNSTAQKMDLQGQVVDKEPEPIVLYDDHGIYIEYRGLEDYYNSSAIINLYFENNSPDELFISQEKMMCNRVNLHSINGLIDLEKNSVFLSLPNYHFVIDYNELKQNGIKSIESIDFILDINRGSWVDEQSTRIPVHIELDYQIP